MASDMKNYKIIGRFYLKTIGMVEDEEWYVHGYDEEARNIVDNYKEKLKKVLQNNIELVFEFGDSAFRCTDVIAYSFIIKELDEEQLLKIR